MVVEKIVSNEEKLEKNWPVDGTSGYEFLVKTNALFVCSTSEDCFNDIYSSFTGITGSAHEIEARGKALVLRLFFDSELTKLANDIQTLFRKDRCSRDFSLSIITEALAAIVVGFPVYRSYIANEDLSLRDREWIEAATENAIKRSSELGEAVLLAVKKVLLLSPSRYYSTEHVELQRHIARRVQQLTSPVTAKGIEDTAFYRYNRLISLNEVGGDPAVFGITSEAMHAFLIERQEQTPLSLSPLSTHDTKRSEDVRARLNVLSEVPERWREVLAQWKKINSADKKNTNIPDANEEYLLYQALLGTWPSGKQKQAAAFRDRFHEYAIKALREAKVHTAWGEEDEKYEFEVKTFIDSILGNNEFMESFCSFQKSISYFGSLNSLSQSVLRICAPGIPDTYQGTEIPNFSFVDPDNRREVDYNALMSNLEEVRQSNQSNFSRESLERGEPKLWVISRALQFRRKSSDLFTKGRYIPLEISTSEDAKLSLFGCKTGKNDTVFAFAREFEGGVGDSCRAQILYCYLRRKRTTDRKANLGRGYSCICLSTPPQNGKAFFQREKSEITVKVTERCFVLKRCLRICRLEFLKD